MLVSTLTSDFQVAMPRAVRDALSLRAGDRIEFVIEQHGVRVCRATPADAKLRELEVMLAPEWASTHDDAAYADL